MAEPRKNTKKTAKKTTAKTPPKRTATRSSTSSTTVPPVSELAGRTISDSADELARAAHGWVVDPAVEIPVATSDSMLVGRKGNLVDPDKPVEEIPKGPIKGVHPDLVVYDEIPGDTMQATSDRDTDPVLDEYLSQGPGEFPQDEADRLEREQVIRETHTISWDNGRQVVEAHKPSSVDERRLAVNAVNAMGPLMGNGRRSSVLDGYLDTGVPIYDDMLYIYGIDPTEPWEPSRCAFDDAALGDMIEGNGCGPWSQSWAFIHARENPGHQTTQSLGDVDRCRTCGARSPMADAMLSVTITGDTSAVRTAIRASQTQFRQETEQLLGDVKKLKLSTERPVKKKWWQR